MQSNLKKAGILAGLLLVIAAVSVGGSIYIEGSVAETPENETVTVESEAETSRNEAVLPESTAEILENTGNDAESSRTEEAADESAENKRIDFDALYEKNPDIFAWLCVPGTEIDYPVLQSGQSDTFYENHNAYGEEDDAGAVYIELANLTSMCDFNTVLHGKAGADGNGLFADLYRFQEPDFFKEHEYAYVYLDGNALVYEIFAAYEREDTSLIRTYDFTYLSGCQQFLDDLYATRDMGMNLREGWEGVNAYHYLITLTTRDEKTGRQFIVTAALIQDTEGTISRIVTE